MVTTPPTAPPPRLPSNSYLGTAEDDPLDVREKRPRVGPLGRGGGGALSLVLLFPLFLLHLVKRTNERHAPR